MKSNQKTVTRNDSKEEPVKKEPAVATEDVKPVQETKQEDVKEAESVSEVDMNQVSVVESGSLMAKVILPAIVGAIAGAITATAVLFVFNLKKPVMKNTSEQAISQEPTSASVPTATPTPETVDLTLFDITVHNGSGVGGTAGKVEKFLKDKGFSVLEIGNADASTYKKTVIKAKEKVPKSFIDKLKESLSENYVLDETTTLEDKFDSDILIIVGSDTPKTAE